MTLAPQLRHGTAAIKILGLGLVTVDHVMTLDGYPDPDTKNEAISSCLQMGGPVPIALAQLRNFGYSAELLSSWGDDPFGGLIEARLQLSGIAFHPRSRQEGTTSVAQIWLNQKSGERTLVTSRTPGHGIQERLLQVNWKEFQALHLDCWPTEVARLAAFKMKESGGIVCIDTGSPKSGVQEILRMADVVNAPQRFCELFLRESDPTQAALKLAKFGPRWVTVTAGEQGAVLSHQGTTFFQPAIQYGPIVDTNGAGDSFSGALIHGVLSGWEPERVLKFAATCASLKCTQLGNEAALPLEAEILQKLI